MSQQPASGVKTANQPPAWAWGKSLGAAAWPTLCALGLAVYAFFPQRFPAETGFALCLLIPAEIPALLLGLAHAAALGEHSLRGRLMTFFAWVGTAALIFGLFFVLEIRGEDLWQLAPIMFWVLVPYVIGLIPNNNDPALVSKQAEALISDRLTLIALIPSIVIVGTLLAISTIVLLGLISIALGNDLVGQFTGFLGNALNNANPSLFALFGSAYLLLGAASAAYVHSPQFLLDRKNMLDRPWIDKVMNVSGKKSANVQRQHTAQKRRQRTRSRLP